MTKGKTSRYDMITNPSSSLLFPLLKPHFDAPTQHLFNRLIVLVIGRKTYSTFIEGRWATNIGT